MCKYAKLKRTKEERGNITFHVFCAVVGFRDISVVLWYAEKWYICQSYLTYFSYHARHNIFGMLCERFALLKQWPSVQLSIAVFVFESISVVYFWAEKWEWDVCQSHSRLDVTCFGRKSYHTTAVLFVQCVFHKSCITQSDSVLSGWCPKSVNCPMCINQVLVFFVLGSQGFSHHWKWFCTKWLVYDRVDHFLNNYWNYVVLFLGFSHHSKWFCTKWPMNNRIDHLLNHYQNHVVFSWDSRITQSDSVLSGRWTTESIIRRCSNIAPPPSLSVHSCTRLDMSVK